MLFKATHRIASTADSAAAAQFGSYAGRGLREAQHVSVAEAIGELLEPRAEPGDRRGVAAAGAARVTDLLREREAHAHRLAAIERRRIMVQSQRNGS